MCGEKFQKQRGGHVGQGSPPRVRGKARHLVRGAVKRGITPACAGKREPPPAFRACGRDHPRVCGEKRAARRAAAGRAGSPPRVRGKAAIPVRLVPAARITPACAGKRGRGIQRRITQGDHPRVCGEKSPAHSCSGPSWGSPPRVRGKGSRHRQPAARPGITPACAGKSCPFLRRTSPRRDHPRVCGEKHHL